MGVKGLTTYISQDFHRYHENYQLFDSYLVIDGNNIACQLYRWHLRKNDCFGGDYDKFATTILTFFKHLSMCNVMPIVVLDGGYENRKMKTVFKRIRNRISSANGINSVNQNRTNFFPLFVKEVFSDIVMRLNLRCVRTDYEGDYEMACLAQNLKCPLLSLDSDFYVFDVIYIPFSKFHFKVSNLKLPTSKTQHYVKCQRFNIEKFSKSLGGVPKSNLPLFATLLGNDYIKMSTFGKFYSQLKLLPGSKGQNHKQRQIKSVANWLKFESKESALKKILEQLKKPQRRYIAERIENIVNGYRCRKSSLFPYIRLGNNSVSSIVEEKKIEVSKLILELENVPDNSDENFKENNSEPTSECSSDWDNLGDNDVELTESCNLLYETSSGIPNWFLDKFRKFCYPSTFMDILTRNMIFCVPQIENYKNDCSHIVSVPIMAAIHKILTSGTKEKFTYISRGKNSSNIKKTHCFTSDKNLPKLEELQFNVKKFNDYILDVLDFDLKTTNEILNILPNCWKLYFISITYWSRILKDRISRAHIYSSVLCAIVLSFLDDRIGSRSTFSKKFKRIVPDQENILIPKETFDEKNLSSFFKKITRKEVYLCMKSLINYFQMERKMSSNPKLYDVEVVDTFSNLQSVLLYTKYLNILLQLSFTDLFVYNFFNGTFLYNMTTNLQKRNDMNFYLLEVLLKGCPNILKVVTFLSDKIFSLMDSDVNNISFKKKRRKKRNKNKSIISECKSDVVVIDENLEGDEKFLDVNNKFSSLQIVE